MRSAMKIISVEKRDERLVGRLFGIWKGSVRQTHLFLSAPEIENIASFVPDALKRVEMLTVAVDSGGKPCAFMGVEDERVEMLFVAPQERGRGAGRQLLTYGIEKLSVKELYVNEQNPQAKGFYEHMGFVVCGRVETDGQGNPYPLLHMRLR